MKIFYQNCLWFENPNQEFNRLKIPVTFLNAFWSRTDTDLQCSVTPASVIAFIIHEDSSHLLDVLKRVKREEQTFIAEQSVWVGEGRRNIKAKGMKESKTEQTPEFMSNMQKEGIVQEWRGKREWERGQN